MDKDSVEDFTRIARLNRAARVFASRLPGSRDRALALCSKNPDNEMMAALAWGVGQSDDLDEVKRLLLEHSERRFWLAGVALRDAMY